MNAIEKQSLRELACRYADAVEEGKSHPAVSLWRDLNRGQMQRPMVVIGQLPWHEFEQFEELRCVTEDGVFQEVEQYMRRQLFMWNHFPVDMVLEPAIPIPLAVEGPDYGVPVQESITATDVNNEVVSHAYVNQFKDYADIEKIKDLQISHDEAESNRRLALAEDIFHGILPIRKQGIHFRIGSWDFLTRLMGVEAIYYDLIERPEFMHALIERVTQSTISGIKLADALLLHDDNAITCHLSYVFSDDLLPAPGEGRGALAQNCWAYGMAQLFTSVSPEMTREFEVPYVSRIAKLFGGIYYGCCERLDDRLEMIKEIPQVKKISCSPWSDVDVFAEQIGPKHILSAKPSPAIFSSASVDWETAAADLRKIVQATKRNHVNSEILLKDLSTVAYKPENLFAWAKMAMEIVNDY